jgi:hypothetical protein
LLGTADAGQAVQFVQLARQFGRLGHIADVGQMDAG